MLLAYSSLAAARNLLFSLLTLNYCFFCRQQWRQPAWDARWSPNVHRHANRCVHPKVNTKLSMLPCLFMEAKCSLTVTKASNRSKRLGQQLLSASWTLSGNLIDDWHGWKQRDNISYFLCFVGLWNVLAHFRDDLPVRWLGRESGPRGSLGVSHTGRTVDVSE